MTLKRQPKMMWYTVKKLLLPTLAVAALLLTGCAGGPGVVDTSDPKVAAFLANKPDSLKPLYIKLLSEKMRNEVLNNMQIGVAAMELGHFELAEESFDAALDRIETIYASTESAAKARSLWFAEGAKDFKGEAYERAMAYYYRGLLYLRQGDYENARASFKGGIMQDAFAEEDQFRCDFAILIFLEGWASQQLGDTDLTRQAYEEVKKLRPSFVEPDPDDNVLLIAETGKSPRKVLDGMGHYQLKFRRGKGFKENRASFIVNDEEIKAYPMEDIYWQSTTRGGRPVDKILKGKAVFRQQAGSIGTTLGSLGSNTMLLSNLAGGSLSSGMQGVGAGLAVLGSVAAMAAIHSTPRADDRYWKNLPDTVHYATTHMSEPAGSVSVAFSDKRHKEYFDLNKETSILASKNSGLAWSRSRTALGRGNKWHNVFK